MLLLSLGRPYILVRKPRSGLIRLHPFMAISLELHPILPRISQIVRARTRAKGVFPELRKRHAMDD